MNYKTINYILITFFKDNPKTPEGFTFQCFGHYHVLQGINIKEVSKRYNTNYIREVISVDIIMYVLISAYLLI